MVRTSQVGRNPCCCRNTQRCFIKSAPVSHSEDTTTDSPHGFRICSFSHPPRWSGIDANRPFSSRDLGSCDFPRGLSGGGRTWMNNDDATDRVGVGIYLVVFSPGFWKNGSAKTRLQRPPGNAGVCPGLSGRWATTPLARSSPR
jgi:hypothetical protein